MRAQRAHCTNRDGPDTPHQKFQNETQPDFLDYNACFISFQLKRMKTERAETDGRPTGPPHVTTETTPTTAPAVHDANKEPTTRAAYGTAALRAGHAWKRSRAGNRAPRATVPAVKIERDVSEGSYTPDTSYDSSPLNDQDRDEPPTGAAVAMAFYTVAASGVTPDTKRTWSVPGEPKTRVDRVYDYHPRVYQPEATLNHAPLQKFTFTTTTTNYHTTHSPVPASTVLPATALRVQGGAGQTIKKNHRMEPNHPSSPGMRLRLLRPTNPTHVHLIRSTERRASGRRAGAARHPPVCSCPQEGGTKKNCPHKRPGPARRPEHNTNLLTNLLWQDER